MVPIHIMVVQLHWNSKYGICLFDVFEIQKKKILFLLFSLIFFSYRIAQANKKGKMNTSILLLLLMSLNSFFNFFFVIQIFTKQNIKSENNEWWWWSSSSILFRWWWQQQKKWLLNLPGGTPAQQEIINDNIQLTTNKKN